MKFIVFCLAFVFTLCKPYDICLTVPEILKAHKYSFETHKVHTSDGFILSVFRITGRENSEFVPGKPAIVIQHGVSASPSCFLINGESSFPLYLVNRGYDVWLPSGRGTYYSQNNTKFTRDSKKYWDFSFEELGNYDTKAYLDYIYNLTNQKVIYLGYSQGFMQMMAAFSLDPEFFQKRLKKIVGWGAVTRLDLSTNAAIGFLSYVNLRPLLSISGITHIGGFNKDSCVSHHNLCVMFPFVCKISVMVNGDFLPYINNPNTEYIGDIQSGKAMDHFAYIIQEHGFVRHPSKTNGKRVEYDLSKVTGLPIGICVGEVDLLAPPANGKWLEKQLGNNPQFKVLGYYKQLGHRGFLIAHNIFEHYTDTLNFLRE